MPNEPDYSFEIAVVSKRHQDDTDLLGTWEEEDKGRINSNDKLEAIEAALEKSKKRSTINLIKPHHNFTQVRTYRNFPIAIARYAVTVMTTSPDLLFLCDPNQSLGTQPGTVSISTDVNEITNTLGNCLAVFKNGVVSAFLTEAGIYIVEIASWKEEYLDELVAAYTQALEKGNFYRGKVLQFGHAGVTFVSRPQTKLEDVILPEQEKRNFYSNTIGFIRDKRLQAITRKRGVILAGPPGTGKTSIVRAAFKAVEGTDVSCIFVAGDAFRDNTLQDLVSFVATYLTPCIVVLEDFDLIAYDRKMGHSSIMGDLLTCLDGIERDTGSMVVIGTTNRIDILDEAVTRPGRFDRRIMFDYPSQKLLEDMWKTKNGPGEPPSILGDGKLTGAHVEEIITTASMLAVENDKQPIECVAEAVETVKTTFLLQQPSVGFGKRDDDDMPRTQLGRRHF